MFSCASMPVETSGGRFLGYQEARNFIEQTTRFGSVLGLTNMRALMEELGNPQDDINIIHIAGTNGKGSVGAYLASILKEAGLKVGRYCSPAVFSPLECWQYDDRNITEEEYAYYLSQVKNACDIVITKGIQPTVFEIETAMAFVYFKEMKVDFLLLETGLGGETDATNIIKHPFACVFTTISRDHMQFLGETLTEIATVKAGIIKKDALVFSAIQEQEVEAVLNQKYLDVNCSADVHDRELSFAEEISYVDAEKLDFISQKPGEMRFSYKEREYVTRIAGLYQMKNIALVTEIARKIFLKLPEMSGIQTPYSDVILDLETQDRIMEYGIKNTSWSGRFEVIDENPLFIIDGAHNEDAVKQLAATVENCFTNQPIDFIIGILADKEHEKMLEVMMPFANRVFTVTPPNTRGLDAKILAEEVSLLNDDVVCCDSIQEAIVGALSHSEEQKCPILAFGSLSYLGELKDTYKQICESRMRDV